MAMNDYQWYTSQAKPSKPTHVYDIDAIIALPIQVKTLSRKIDGLPVIQQLAQVTLCDMWGKAYKSRLSSY